MPGVDPPHGIVVVVELPAVVDVVEELDDVVDDPGIDEVDEVDDPPWQFAHRNEPPLPTPVGQQLNTEEQRMIL